MWWMCLCNWNFWGAEGGVTVTAARAVRGFEDSVARRDDNVGCRPPGELAVHRGRCSSVANITPVGNGPFGVRPRLRGLDSTRLLVLVDGERLNTARQATDRTGAEVGLISPDAISLEIVNGAGTLLYGSDALAGTLNIITNEPSFSQAPRWQYGFNGFFSTNERGRRRGLEPWDTSPRVAVRLQAGMEAYDNYEAGSFDVEDTRPLFASGQLDQRDTIDDNFGFRLNAFPDPFNAPYVRTEREIRRRTARSSMRRAWSGLAKHGRFGSAISGGEWTTSVSRTSRCRTFSMRRPCRTAISIVPPCGKTQAVTPWLANLSLAAHYQRTERLLQNLLPIQFPAPSPAFFPDQRIQARHSVEHRTARVVLRGRSAGDVRSRGGSRARAASRFSGSKRRFADHYHDHVAHRAEWRSVSSVPRPLDRPPQSTRSARGRPPGPCPRREPQGMLRYSFRTSGAYPARCRSSPGFAATSTV